VKQATVYSSTVPFCYHFVQKPAAEVLVQVEVEAMLNLAEFDNIKRKANRASTIQILIILNSE
jgi:hypothetical protein